MNAALDIIAKQFGELRVKRDEPMSLHTNNKIGGPADLYLETVTTDELVTVVRLCIELRVPYVVLGSSTNVLVSDRGVRGVVIKHRASTLKISGYKGVIRKGEKKLSDVLVEVEAGCSIGHLVRQTIEEGLAGMESFLGLPGTVGGAVYNNAHFQRHGAFFGDHVVSCKVVDTHGKINVLQHDDLKFGYDDSRLQRSREILLTATLRLTNGDKRTLWAKADEASREIRLKEQPYQIPSHGCTFQNVTRQQAIDVELPGANQSVGALVDACGMKGLRFGDAQVSDQHGNFIVNRGHARAADVMELMQRMRKRIKERYGLSLKPEIFLIGAFTAEERKAVGA